MEGISRVCKKCGIEKALETGFKARQRVTLTYRHICCSCVSLQLKDYREKHKEVLAELSKSWREANKEKLLQKRIDNRAWMSVYNREYHKKNFERLTLRAKERYDNNENGRKDYYKNLSPEKKAEHIAICKAWDDLHPGHVRARGRKYDSTHREKRSEQKKRWNSEHPEEAKVRAKVQKHKRRARESAAGGWFTGDEWLSLIAFYGWECLCCNRKEPEIKLEADHVISISRGGNGYISNIQPLCRTCNSRKGTKDTDFRITYVKNSGTSSPRETIVDTWYTERDPSCYIGTSACTPTSV